MFRAYFVLWGKGCALDSALEKYQYEQSLEHTSEFIERLENELAEYHEHLARFKKQKD